MRRLSDPLPSVRHEFSRLRLRMLTGVSLLPPVTFAVQQLLGQNPRGWAVVITSTVLFVLVLARMSTLLDRLRVQAAQLTDLARTDPLTSLPNRRSADAELERMRNRSLLDRSPLCVAMVDLDRFKLYNDTHGHPAGDQLLVGAARAWRIALAGTGAMLARWGGEEFVVMAVGLEPSRVEQLLGDLRAVVPAGQTFSAGLARWDGHESLAGLFARADTALYAAKSAGRDRTCSAQTPDTTEVIGLGRPA
ncbi:MAG: GGDEF domain-containing protein, partial [Janthinobacterium lividum]